MLVLSRKKNESIVINDNIVITVVEIRGDKVRLGIEAPKDVPVHRQGGYEAVHGGRDPGVKGTGVPAPVPPPGSATADGAGAPRSASARSHFAPLRPAPRPAAAGLPP